LTKEHLAVQLFSISSTLAKELAKNKDLEVFSFIWIKQLP